MQQNVLITHFLKDSLANPILSLAQLVRRQGSSVWTKGIDKHRLLLDIFLLVNIISSVIAAIFIADAKVEWNIAI